MTTIAKHYYETHVTIEPVFEEALEKVKEIGKRFGFKVAELLMKKRTEDTETRSKYDTFMTGHDKDLAIAIGKVTALVLELKNAEIKVWRYKIEDTIMDSRINDELGILK